MLPRGASKPDIWLNFFLYNYSQTNNKSRWTEFATLSLSRQTKPKCHLTGGDHLHVSSDLINFDQQIEFAAGNLVVLSACRTAFTKSMEVLNAFLVGARSFV